MAGVKFEDFSVQVKNALESAAIAYLEEVSGEIEAQTVRNMDRSDTKWPSQVKNSWQHRVDKGELEATVGNPLEMAIWAEKGTGEHALEGNGRKGYWVYIAGEDGSASTHSGGKTYTLEEAKQVMAMLQAKGLDAHVTNGRKPTRMFETAYNEFKPKAIKRAQQIFGEHIK